MFRYAAWLIFVATLSGCGSVALEATDPPVAEEVGPSTVKVASSEVWAVLDYRFASQNLGSEWLIVELGVTAADRRSADIKRDAVFVRTPEGRRLPLASQGEFSRAYAELRPELNRADVNRRPIYTNFPHNRRLCRFQFFAEPGGDVVFGSVYVNDQRACYERLFFRVPGGVQPGRWMLGIDFEESDIRIPFRL